MSAKGILALLAPEKGGGDDDEKGYDESSSEESDKLDAANDIIAAVKKGDAKALSMALDRHYECRGEE